MKGTENGEGLLRNLLEELFASRDCDCMSELQNILDTRQRNNLYFPQANLTIYQKAAYYSGINIFNNLPLEIKNVAGKKRKKNALKKILYTYSFYTLHHLHYLVVICKLPAPQMFFHKSKQVQVRWCQFRTVWWMFQHLKFQST
jgi:hypothetical protein